MKRAIRVFVTLGVAACGGAAATSDGTVTSPTSPSSTDAGASMAFFFQDVAPLPGGNSVRAGTTLDGRTIDSSGVNLLTWQPLIRGSRGYGDPVFSRLPNGRWVMMAGTPPDDPRGSSMIVIHEGACPRVEESAVTVLPFSRASGCATSGTVLSGKFSEVLTVDGSSYVFANTGGQVRLLRLSDAGRTPAQLGSICLRTTAVPSLADLQVGDAAVLFDPATTPGLLLSDTAVARRADGTFVLFIKGIAPTSGCSGGNLCELCARSIYRTTSRDLITWTPLVKVVDQASVPEAATFPDGLVRLYWQSFQETCAARSLQIAARAPIRGAVEGADGTLGVPFAITIPKEAFETNVNLHYPTNANPILLPDGAAAAALATCLAR